MALEVYWASGSPFSWRVLLTLEVKQLPYQSKLLMKNEDTQDLVRFGSGNLEN